MDKSYYLFSAKALHRKDNSLQVHLNDGTKRYVPIEKVRDLYLFSEASINLPLLRFLGKKGIHLHVFDYYGHYTGSFHPKEKRVSGELLVNQVRVYDAPAHRLRIAKSIISAAVHNISRNLKYYDARGCLLDDEIQEITSLSNRIASVENVPQLMGIEGNVRQIYYRAWSRILPEDFAFDVRTRRPPQNEINALMSYMNMMVYTAVLSEIYKTPLNPLISFLHEPGEKRYSLSLDIAEIYKPLLADRIIFSVLNRGQVTQKDFDEESGGFRLSENAVKVLAREFDEHMSQTFKNKSIGRKVSYRTQMRLDCWRLVKDLMGEEQFEAFRLEW